jgi:hypothetical protein
VTSGQKENAARAAFHLTMAASHSEAGKHKEASAALGSAQRRLEAVGIPNTVRHSLDAARRHLEAGRHKLAAVTLRTARDTLGRDLSHLATADPESVVKPEGVPPSVELVTSANPHFRWTGTRESPHYGTEHSFEAESKPPSQEQKEIDRIYNEFKGKGYEVTSSAPHGRSAEIRFEHPLYGKGVIRIRRVQEREKGDKPEMATRTSKVRIADVTDAANPVELSKGIDWSGVDAAESRAYILSVPVVESIKEEHSRMFARRYRDWLEQGRPAGCEPDFPFDDITGIDEIRADLDAIYGGGLVIRDVTDPDAPALLKAMPPKPPESKPLEEHRIRGAHRTPPKEKTEKAMKCPRCGEAMEGEDYVAAKRGMARHMQENHSEKTFAGLTKAVYCPHCGRRFNSRHAHAQARLAEHLDEHEKEKEE